MQLEKFAQLTGQSVEDLMNQQRQHIKGRHVQEQLSSGVNWNEDQKALITNKAQLKDGQWMVTMDNGEEKAVSNLSAEDLNHLMPETTDEKLVNYVYDIRDMVTKLAEAKQQANARLEYDGYAQWIQEENQRIKTVTTEFNTNYSTYLKEFQEKMRLATTSQQKMIDLMETGNENIDRAATDIKREGENIATTLADINTKLQSCLTSMAGLSMNPLPPKLASLSLGYHKAGQDPVNLIPEGGYMSGGMIMTPVKDSSGQITKFNMSCAPDNVGRNIDYRYTSSPAPVRDDGILTSTNQPMVTAATSITPIHDGSVQLAKSDPADTAIFAKTGGPFDTLFNGIFAKVTDLHSWIVEPSPKANETVCPEASIVTIANKINNSPSEEKNIISFDKPLELRGTLKLEGLQGQSVDIMSELRNNPVLLRTLTQMISETISRNMGGGRLHNNNFNLTGGLGVM